MREIDNLTGIAQSLKRIDKNLGRIADALEKKKPRTVNVQGCKEATEQGRKELAETIRDILLSQVMLGASLRATTLSHRTQT